MSIGPVTSQRQLGAGQRLAVHLKPMRAAILMMNCTLEGHCIKAFGRAIHALSRIGEDMWLDPTDKGLALRSVNSAQSSYACFLFSPLFFQHFSLKPAPQQSGGSIKCKLIIKSVLPLFRCLTSIDRSVERCQISISASSDRVIFQFVCHHGIKKTHNLCFQECEALHAVFVSQQCPNVLKSPARLLGDMVMHFPLSQEEVTLSTTPLRVSLKNYIDRGNDRLKTLYTEMALHPDEFDFFQVREDSDITFCLKELRGLLSFAEPHCLPVTLHFGAAGNPVCFSVEDVVLEASLVLATLINPDSGNSQPPETPVPSTSRCEEADVTAMIPSSQGSLISQQCPTMQLLPQIHDANNVCVSNRGGPSAAAATPASSLVCSLLFGSSEQNDDPYHTKLHVLACCSDEDEDMEDNAAL